MTIRSSVPSVITAVLSMITTAVAGQVDSVNGGAVAVVDGELGTYVANEYVQIVGTTGGHQQWASIGTQRRDESYDITGLIRAYVGNDDQAHVRQRVYDLFALIETALDDDPQLGGVVNGTVEAVPVALDMGVTNLGGRAAELHFALSVTTQLIAT